MEQTVKMSADELAQFEAFKKAQAKQQAKEERKKNLETFNAMIDDQVRTTIPELDSAYYFIYPPHHKKSFPPPITPLSLNHLAFPEFHSKSNLWWFYGDWGRDGGVEMVDGWWVGVIVWGLDI